MSIVYCHEVWPPLNADVTLYMLEVFGASLVVSSPHPVDVLRVQLWTNLVSRHNSEGAWQGIDLSLAEGQPDGAARFEGGVQATSEGAFQFTYRFGLKDAPGQWQWLGRDQDDGRLQILPPSADMKWTQGPRYAEILPGIFVGNFIAAAEAARLGFGAVLNLAEELTPTFAPEDDIAYRKLPCRDGAVHPIDPAFLREGVAWVMAQQRAGRRVLINCRAGIGRSGSLGVACCFSQNLQWSYEQTLEYVWSKKPDIYPHSQLQKSLEALFPRQVE